MSWISEDDIKAIRQQADIVDVMSRYITLEKKGKDYKAICPFHDDHDPSLSISTDKQIFKCFVWVPEEMSLHLYKRLKTFPF